MTTEIAKNTTLRAEMKHLLADIRDAQQQSCHSHEAHQQMWGFRRRLEAALELDPEVADPHGRTRPEGMRVWRAEWMRGDEINE